MRGPFDAVIWDYDGTLVDSRAGDEAAVASLVAADGAFSAGVEAFWAGEGRPIAERIELAWPGRSRDLVDHFDGVEPPPVVPGVPEVLEELRRRGLGLAVVSTRRLEPLLRGLAAGGIGLNFQVVIGLETVQRPKPDPQGMLLAMDHMGVTPARVVVVGDLDVDIEAARRAGASAWRAVWSLTPEAASRWPEGLTSPVDVLARLDGPLAAAG